MASREHYHSNAKANSWSSDALRMRFESCKSIPTKVTFVIYLSFNATNISRIKRTNVPVFCKSVRPSFRYGNEKVFVNPDSHSFRLAAYRQKSTERNVPFVASKQIQNSIQWWFVIHIFMLDYRWIVRNVQDLIFSSLTWFLSDGTILNYELTRQATQHAHHDRSSWCTWPPGTPQLPPMASLAFPLKTCLWLKRMTLMIPFRHALPGSFVAIDGAFRSSNIGLVDVRRAGSSLLDLCPSSVCHRCSGSNLCLDQSLCNLPIQFSVPSYHTTTWYPVFSSSYHTPTLSHYNVR